jgi:uncharacterized hydrophobic protein (TIGR00271 family)
LHWLDCFEAWEDFSLPNYVDSALFVYTDESVSHIELLKKNSLGVTVTAVSYESLKQNIATLQNTDHVVISGSISFLKRMFHYAMAYDFSIGIIPLPRQKNIPRSLMLPSNMGGLIDRALRKDAQAIDLILCNNKILFFKATIGRIPLIDNPEEMGKLRIFWDGIKMITSLKLLPFSISASGEQETDIETAASGCMIVQHHKRSLASKLIAHDSTLGDGMISMVIVAPFSVIDYLKFVFQTLSRSEKDKSIPNATGYIKRPEITIDTENKLRVSIDGENQTTTPVHCKVLPGAVRVNIGEELSTEGEKTKTVKKRTNISALPSGKELIKARNKKIPFFTYASEDRFRDLFVALKDDANPNVSYFVLMMLSTLLATTGLYLNSSSVIIGAMLLAPLMAPIISLAMGLLRQSEGLIKHSIGKIIMGVSFALLIAALMTLLFPHKPVTGEMEARLSPTVLDLIVAITAGVAGAYTKSHKEILQSLAGVAIAVALVPPLAVAGIGIGRLDLEFFTQAFLLFSTNIIGIVLAATFTFRLLGYSPAVKNRRGISIVFILLALISIPLYLSYHEIVETNVFEKSWQEERFLVHGKYLIVQKARLSTSGDKDVLTVEILVRDQLTRYDLTEFKQKIRHNISENLVIRANVIYIP